MSTKEKMHENIDVFRLKSWVIHLDVIKMKKKMDVFRLNSWETSSSHSIAT